MDINACKVFNTVSGTYYPVTIGVIVYFCDRKENDGGEIVPAL